jgi:hypothetical protein
MAPSPVISRFKKNRTVLRVMAPVRPRVRPCLLLALLWPIAHAFVGRAPVVTAFGLSSRMHPRIGRTAMRLDDTEPALESPAEQATDSLVSPAEQAPDSLVSPAEQAPDSLVVYLLPYAGGVVVAFLLASAAFYALVMS